MKSNSHWTSGYTLVELLGGILVFAFGLLALYRAQIAVVKNNSFAHHLTKATMLAQDQLETFLNTPYVNPYNPDDEDWPWCDRNRDGGDKSNGYGLDKRGQGIADHFIQGEGRFSGFSISWNIANDQPIAGNKTIRLIVDWTDQGSVTHSMSMDCVKGPDY